MLTHGNMVANVLQVAAWVSPHLNDGEEDPTLTEGELLAHCKQHLTTYKMPRIVEFRSEPLPKAKIGKILRRELRDGSAAVTAQAASLPVASA
jgi:acyl-CoA synthetase (AMP-forming)/AMP-acid ligase II